MITNNPSDIYFFRPDLPSIDTAILFNITQENEVRYWKIWFIKKLLARIEKGSFVDKILGTNT